MNPGPDSGRPSHIRCLTVSYDDELADRACSELTKFGNHYISAGLPDWYYQIAVAGRMMALLKKETVEGEEPEARPIACGNIVQRLIHGVPYQVAIGTSGASQQLCFGVHELLERFPKLAGSKQDLQNAFNEFRRCELCHEVKPLRPLLVSSTEAQWRRWFSMERWMEISSRPSAHRRAGHRATRYQNCVSAFGFTSTSSLRINFCGGGGVAPVRAGAAEGSDPQMPRGREGG
jgi:hypothetical protein